MTVAIQSSGVSKVKPGNKWVPMIVLGLGLLGVSTGVLAQEDVLGDGICGLVNQLIGRWLFGISVLGMLGGGAALLMGGEMRDGVKLVVTLVTILGFIVSFSKLIVLLFAKFGVAAC